MSFSFQHFRRFLLTIPYIVAHWLRDHLPFVWKVAEFANATLFRLCYAHRLRQIEPTAMQMATPFEMVPIADVPTDQLVAFFQKQPKELYRWFTPHGFETDDIKALQKNPSFLGYVFKQDGKIVSYFFLRCYCNGECYFGRLVDSPYMRQGIGTLMNQISFYISESLQLDSYQTIANGNIASIRSCAKAYRLKPVRSIANGDILYKNCKL